MPVPERNQPRLILHSHSFPFITYDRLHIIYTDLLTMKFWTTTFVSTTTPLWLAASSCSASSFSAEQAAAFRTKKTLFGSDLKERYDSGQPWTTLEDGTEFQPAAAAGGAGGDLLSPLAQEHLRRLTGGGGKNDFQNDSPFHKLYVDGAETYYDEYAQAWRALGWYIDCDYCDDEDGECWWNQYGDYADNNNETEYDRDEQRNSGCRRFVLWAAYVDENYSGNGAGEYKYYDRKSNQWDSSICNYENSKRCVPMDCHLPNTHFTLLGFFKEPNYDEWLEQLFKHQGDCLWDDDEYQLMQSDRNAWPQGCVSTIFTTSHGSTIHYAIKPLLDGEMGIGLYTDDGCIEEYTGGITADEILRTMVCGGYVQSEGQGDGDNMITEWMCESNNTDYLSWYQKYVSYNSGYGGDAGHDAQNNVWSLDDYLNVWNAAFDVFKQCQPCKTYDLTHSVAGIGYIKNHTGTRYRKSDHELENMNDDAYIREYLQNDTFHCHDDAGADNVNQCMKFSRKTKMLTASWTDIEQAAVQGSIVNVQIRTIDKLHGAYRRGARQKAVWTSWAFLILGSILFVGSALRYRAVKKEVEEQRLNEPLTSRNPTSVIS